MGSTIPEMKSNEIPDLPVTHVPSGEGRSDVKNRFPDGFRVLKGKQEYITYLDLSSIRIWTWDREGHYDLHMHSAVEIMMPLRGTPHYHLPDCDYDVSPEEILILPSQCPHILHEDEDVFRHLILFEPNPLLSLRDVPRLSEMMEKPIYLQKNTELREKITAMLMEIIHCYHDHSAMWNTLCYSFLLQIYALLGQEYLHSSMPRPDPRLSMDSPILNSAITYINEHYMDDISLDDVASFAGFSKCYFSRTFKQFAGVSFTDFLLRKRLNVAIDLLVRTNEPIQSVARSSGFASTATFNRVFREAKNCTPSQFRSIYGLVED